MEEDKETQDIFKKEYIELLYYLQEAIENTEVAFEGAHYEIGDFCFRPITGEGCMVTSPTEFWKMDLEEIQKDADPKKTAQCIPTPEQSGRICFDRIGVPVQVNAIFGGTVCNKDDSVPCAPCILDASALSVTYLLNNNEYSNPTAAEWELHSFIRNIKTFNHAVGY